MVNNYLRIKLTIDISFIAEIYNDYKKQVITPNENKIKDEKEKKDTTLETKKESNEDTTNENDDEKEQAKEQKEIDQKKIIKKLKTKFKGEKENVLKTIKLKMK